MGTSQRNSELFKHRRITCDLRDKIVHGVLKPGERLPNRDALVHEYGVTLATIQRVMDILATDGFVVARGSSGTYVSDYLPHLCRFGLAFPRRPESEFGWPMFWRALSVTARAMERPDRQIVQFMDIDGHTDVEDFLVLSSDIESHRLAGVLVMCEPNSPLFSVLQNISGVPWIMPLAPGQRPELGGGVVIDSASFLEKALDYLHDRGRRNIAFLMGLHQFGRERETAIQESLARRGMATRPYWCLRYSESVPDGARNLVHLLVNPAQTQRPDALVVWDDNLAEPAGMGVVDAGISIGDPLDVVAHCNYPLVPKSIPGIRWLGYGARQVLDSAIMQIGAWRNGRRNGSSVVKAQFLEELSPSALATPLEGAFP